MYILQLCASFLKSGILSSLIVSSMVSVSGGLLVKWFTIGQICASRVVGRWVIGEGQNGVAHRGKRGSQQTSTLLFYDLLAQIARLT